MNVTYTDAFKNAMGRILPNRISARVTYSKSELLLMEETLLPLTKRRAVSMMSEEIMKKVAINTVDMNYPQNYSLMEELVAYEAKVVIIEPQELAKIMRKYGEDLLNEERGITERF